MRNIIASILIFSLLSVVTISLYSTRKFDQFLEETCQKELSIHKTKETASKKLQPQLLKIENKDSEEYKKLQDSLYRIEMEKALADKDLSFYKVGKRLGLLGFLKISFIGDRFANLDRENYKEASAISTEKCPKEFSEKFKKYIACSPAKNAEEMRKLRKELEEMIEKYPKS
jgi:hypothetical protein